MRDVVVLGPKSGDPKTVAIAKATAAELGLTAVEAKRRIDHALQNGEPIAVPVAPSTRAFDLARELDAAGFEVRVLAGHAGGGCGLPAHEQLSELREAVVRANQIAALEPRLAALASIPHGSRVADLPDLRTAYDVALDHCGSLAEAERRPQPPSDWTGPFDLPDALAEYFERFGPRGLELRGYGNSFWFPPLASLWEYQVGYRSDAGSGGRLASWDDDWLVVADCGADPFILSRRDGCVLYTQHGMGRWDPVELFPDIATMAAALTAVGAPCTAAGKDLTDEDSRITPAWRRRLVRELAPLLGGEAKAEAVLALLGYG